MKSQFRVLIIDGREDYALPSSVISESLPDHVQLESRRCHNIQDAISRLAGTLPLQLPHMVVCAHDDTEDRASAFGQLTIGDFMAAAAAIRLPTPIMAMWNGNSVFTQLNGRLVVMTVEVDDAETLARFTRAVVHSRFPAPPSCHAHDAPAQMFRNGDLWRCGTCRNLGADSTLAYEAPSLFDLLGGDSGLAAAH